jgi:predicted secreted Zn-dependent protease
MTYGALYHWPTGDHELTVEAYFNADVNDGWDIYPAGTLYRDVYRVKVLQNIDPVGIEYLGDTNYACYYIQGSNGYHLAAQMDKNGPDHGTGDVWATAKIEELKYSGGACYADGTVDLTDFEVTVSTLITVPCWYPPAGTSPAEIAKFENLMSKIARHELRHVEIKEQYVRILEQRFNNSNTCDGATWDEIEEQVWEEERAAQEAFHASPEGQRVRYP